MNRSMNTATKLVLYSGLLVAMFAGGAALGAVAGPIDIASSADHSSGVDHRSTESTTEPTRPRMVDIVDGFTASLHAGSLHGGNSNQGEVTITVDRAGESVDLVATPGGRGHLVMVRNGDQEPMDVEPLPSDSDDSARFAVELDPADTYVAYFVFTVGDQTHTADFVVDIDATIDGSNGNHRGTDS